MQQRPSLSPLIISHPCPVGASRLARRYGARPGRHGVQDRSVQQRINNLVVGHAALPHFNAPNLTAQLREVAFDRSAVLNGEDA